MFREGSEFANNGQKRDRLEGPQEKKSQEKKKRKRKRVEAMSGRDTKTNSQVVIYTDGACRGNPGPAGIGAVMTYKKQSREVCEYIGNATNNIAELKAVRVALLALKRKDLPVRLYTDSTYVQGVLTKNWRAKKNTELIREIREIISGFADIRILKVPGHKGVEGNEKADQLAAQAIFEHERKSA